MYSMTPEQLEVLKVFADLTFDEQVEQYEQCFKLLENWLSTNKSDTSK